MLLGDFAERSKFSNAGIGEHDIDSSLGCNGLVETIEVGQFRNVPLNAGYIAANCFHGLVELLLATAHDEDVGALFYEELCGSQSYPGCATGNDCHFPLQFLIFGHRCFSSLLLLPVGLKKDSARPAYAWLEVNSFSICWLNPFTKACSPGPGLARKGFAASTRISSASVPRMSKVSEMNCSRGIACS